MEKERKAKSIVKKLQQSGRQAYFAGGCVRDILLGEEPADFDIVTGAKPAEVEAILEKTIPVGRQFGVVLAIVDGHHFHIATFRGEGEYKDNRRPSEVFWVEAEEDAKRRDFTINGLFYNPINKEVIDYVDGQKDIKNKIIRFIGNPEKRIGEDHLRILRAVRFKNVLGFEYDSETEKALNKNAEKIKTISGERIQEELNKMLSDKSRAESLSDLDRLGILQVILPELNATHGVTQPEKWHGEGDVWQHTLLSIKNLPGDTPPLLVWAMLLHDLGKVDSDEIKKSTEENFFPRHSEYSAKHAEDILKRLKFPKNEREETTWLVENHMHVMDIPKMRLGKQRRWFQDSRFPDLMEVFRFDAQGMEPIDLSYYQKIRDLYNEEQKRPVVDKILTGNDVMTEFGLKPGPEVGRLLKIVDEAQLEGKVSTKEEALEYLRKEKDLRS